MKPTPRLALSVTSKPSFIFKRIESLMQWGKDPFHPRRGQLAGVAVCLGIVAVMVALFGQPMQTESRYEDYWKEAKDWRKEALIHSYNSYDYKHGEYIRTEDPVMVLTYPRFYAEGPGKFRYKEKQTIGCRQVCLIYLESFGLLTFSLKPFADAKPAGTIHNAVMDIHVRGLKFRVVSMYKIIPRESFINKEVPVYVKHDPQYDKGRLNQESSDYKWTALKEGLQGYLNIGQNADGSYKSIFHAFGSVEKYEDLYINFPKPAVSFGNILVELNGERSKNIRFMYWPIEYAPFGDDDVIQFGNYDTGRDFSFSLYPFEGASQIAHVEGNKLTVQTPEGLMRITSVENILKTESGLLWFKYRPPEQERPKILNKMSKAELTGDRSSRQAYESYLRNEKEKNSWLDSTEGKGKTAQDFYRDQFPQLMKKKAQSNPN
jgi:hypothetical protein